jgi:hypothetical protein
MIEFLLIAQLVYDTEMSDPRVLECAAQVGVAPESRDFTFTQFQEFLQCRRDNGSFEDSRHDVV